MTTENVNIKARGIVRPLGYEKVHLASKQELIADYTTGRLYMTSADDREKIFDITEEILKLVNTSMPGDNIIINIEGIGKVNLKDYLDKLTENGLKIKSTGNVNSIPSYNIDNQSLVIKDGFFQIVNFDTADKIKIPYKNDRGIIGWENPSSIVKPVTVQPYNGDIILNSGLHYITGELNVNTKIVLNHNATFDYSRIIWNVYIDEIIPNLVFPDNIRFEYDTDIRLPQHCTLIFDFQTWDSGNIWLGSVKKFGDITRTGVSTDYISDNYYTKPEVDEKLSWVMK